MDRGLRQLLQSPPVLYEVESSLVDLKATIVLCKKEFFESSVAAEDGKVWDLEDELSGKRVYLQLVSNDVDSSTGKAMRTSEMMIENWTESSTSSSHIASTYPTKFVVNFRVKKEFGEPGALFVKNFHRNEFLLKEITVEVPNRSSLHFICDSCVYNVDHYAADRAFFTNKVYLPRETPAGLQELREHLLQQLRGNGTGERKEADRIYDYHVYNDLGDSYRHDSLKRPVLGDSDEFPYPRRMRTGRQRSKTDPEAEDRGDLWTNFYIPRDERYTMVKSEKLQEDAIQTASRKLLPAIQALYSRQTEFESVREIADLFKKGVSLTVPSDSDIDLDSDRTTPECEIILTYPTPKVIAVDETAWTMDEEFAREMLAGLNPVVIERLREFPIKSKLDEDTYGDPVSAITAEHIEPFLEDMDVRTALEGHKLFVLDYHDAFLPFVSKINENPACKAYATRTFLFLTHEGILRPVAIEVSLPQESEPGTVKRIFTPPPMGMKDWMWELAKVHVLANDAGYHQLSSHWLRSHATMEPVIIATHRQLSTLHPIYQALVPHMKNTLDINAAARKALINAGGIIEMTFTPHAYAMQISSAVYKQSWRFDEQALPTDLIKRGMAIPDKNGDNGLKLVIEDYPFATDGLELWGAINEWLREYVDLIYSDDGEVEEDRELQSWWYEIRYVGHGDKKDAEGWPTLNSKASLVHTLTTIVWIASCHHAAVNFGQYEYAGFMPNHPTMTRRLIPMEGSPEFLELEQDPEAFYLSTISNETQATVIMTTTEVLSTHSSHEEFLGQRSTPNWTSDEKISAVYGRFQERIGEIEELIKARNQEKRLKNRYGRVQLPYELLYPSSDHGLTGKGVPNSTSI
ncbi:probable linoleate 9S-lipoxygenase 5 isoform X2 [Physcomitrium patens]